MHVRGSKLKAGLALVAVVALVGSGSVAADAGAPPSYYYPVTGQLSTGVQPRSVAIDSSTHTAFVANADDGSLSVVDLDDDTTTATIGVGTSPLSVAVDPDTHRVYVGNHNSDSVVVVDGDPSSPTFHTVLTSISLSSRVNGVAFDPSDDTVLATVEGGQLAIIDATTNEVVGSVGIDALAVAVAVDPTTQTAYVTNSSGGANSVSIIDLSTRTATATVAVGANPRSVVVDPADRRVYVVNSDDASVSVIDATSNTVVGTVGVGATPFEIAVDPDRDVAYVANLDGNSVSVIDTTLLKVVRTVPFGDYALSVAVDRSTHRVLVGSFFGSSLTVLTPTPLVRAAVTGLSSTVGPAAGGEQVTITGSHFGGADRVLFGTTRASFTVVSDTEITATVPAHAAGVVPVRVRTLGLSAKKSASRYRYQ